MSLAAARDAFEAELAAWQVDGRRPRLFWRDDDAVADTQQLRRLIALAERHEAPLLVAAIPAHAEPSLGALLRASARTTGAVHGWAHADHAPVGEKPCEIGRHRPLETVLGELRAGREKLGDMLDGRVSGLLVPPWNRIHDEVLAHIGEAGFAGVSTHGWADARVPAATVNVHVDNIHWSGGRVGREAEWIFAELARNLGEARRRGHRAVGVLTHHLAHDEKAWAGIETILEHLGHGRADWVAADDLLGETAAPGPGRDQA